MGEVVSRKYSTAVFEAALEDGTLEQTKAELERFVELYGEAEAVLLAPSISKQDKRLLLGSMQLSGLVNGLVNILLEKDRLGIVREIKFGFDEMADEHARIAKAVVSTVVPLNDGQLSELKKNLENATGLSIRLETEIDQAIIGGLVVRIGDKVLDGSVRSKLEKMLESIREIK